MWSETWLPCGARPSGPTALQSPDRLDAVYRSIMMTMRMATLGLLRENRPLFAQWSKAGANLF
jgi:hypothetical protein